jgi:hypothetical protein
MEEAFEEQASGRARKSGRGEIASEKTPSQGKLVPPADKAWAEKWRKDLKIAGVSGIYLSPVTFWIILPMQRQFQRLVEMLILLYLDPSDKTKLRAYRLQVKERIYRFNFVSFVFPQCSVPLSCPGNVGNSCAARGGREIRKVGGDIPECQRRLSQDSKDCWLNNTWYYSSDVREEFNTLSLCTHHRLGTHWIDHL